MKSTALALLALAACSRTPKPLVDPELAARLPAHPAMIAGIDLDRLRPTPLFAKLPEALRAGSYLVAAYDPPNLVTASRASGRIEVSGSGAAGGPPDLMRHATADPLWIIARGNAQLPLTGNLANLSRLLEQTDYTRVTARVTDQIHFEIEGVCRSAEAATHLEQNIRAIATFTRVTLDLRVEGATVHVTGSTPFETLDRLF